jgi:outer membrane protein OmpA-like peptidoglycan-associated protein
MPSNQIAKICSVLLAAALVIIISGCQKSKEIAESDTVEISVAEAPTLEIKHIAVHFAYKKATLNAVAEENLTSIVQQAKDHPEYQIELIGHTDAVASDVYNKRLSQQRAEAVRDFLANHGVTADRMTTAWEGEAQPVAPNTTEDGRTQNRRTEITLRPMPATPTPTAMVDPEEVML